MNTNGRTLNPTGETCGRWPTWEVGVQRYLISLSSTTDRSLRVGVYVAQPDVGAARWVAVGLLSGQRLEDPHGTAWDQWTVSARTGRAMVWEIVASGQYEAV